MRTTKTVTWEGVGPALDAHIPTHFPEPAWWSEREQMQADREKKGLPHAVGKRYNAKMSANYNRVKW